MELELYTTLGVVLGGWVVLYVVWSLIFARIGHLSQLNTQFASRCNAFTHSIVVASIALNEVFTVGLLYDIAISPSQTFAIAVSFAYFLIDTLHMIFFEKDLLFFLHHGICLAYLGSVLALGRGGMTVMLCMVVGEVTNPLQSSWWMAKEAKLERAFTILYYAFTLAFLVVRCIIAPIAGLHMIWSFFANEPPLNIPLAYKTLWSFLIVSMILGGILWARDLWLTFKAFLAEKAAQHTTHSPVPLFGKAE